MGLFNLLKARPENSLRAEFMDEARWNQKIQNIAGQVGLARTRSDSPLIDGIAVLGPHGKLVLAEDMRAFELLR